MADQTTIAAGLAVRAADTGRVLMLQRAVADDDPASSKWEFPGGKLDTGESPIQAAIREWQEEIGMTLPTGEFAGGWNGGIYQGFIYVVPREADVPLNSDADDRHVLNPDDPDGDQIEVAAWWPPSDAKAMPGLRDECARTTDWRAIDQAVPDAVFKERVTVVIKDSPTPSGVHVEVPIRASRKRRRRRKPQPETQPETGLAIVKSDRMRQIIYGIVLEPHVEDTQGDWERPIEIEKAAHRYLSKAIRGRARVHTIQHRVRGFFPSGGGIVPVESFIAPCDFSYEGSTDLIRKGSWVLAAHVEDPKLWQDVLDGKFTGWSVGGKGRRVEVVGRTT